MEAATQHVKQLIEQAAQKARVPTTHDGLGRLSEAINEAQQAVSITQKYLYELLKGKIVQAQQAGKDTLGLSQDHLHAIALYLGFESYFDFVAQISQPAVPALLHDLCGQWYSYVRCNSGSPFILRSPVYIEVQAGQVMMHLQGKLRRFSGTVQLNGMHIYATLLPDEADKQLHLIFKTGLGGQHELLQGVFSGISSGGDPIAGREVLVRMPESATELSNARLPLEQFAQSKKPNEQKLALYFATYAGNNVKVQGISTFGWDDLPTP